MAQSYINSATGNVVTKTFTSSSNSLQRSLYADTNSTYSGCDMVASIAIQTEKGTVNQVIGSVQTLTYSISKNIMPVRCLGDINAKDYVDGPRTIAGSLIFTVFDHHWFKNIHDELIKIGVYDIEHYIADELPPFNVTISFANEYGFASRLAIYGIRIANEGQTMSISDIYTENTYQYVAMDIDYMRSVYTPKNTKNTNTLSLDTQSVTVNKPVETIPGKSASTSSTTNTNSQTVSDDYSYSTVSPSSYVSLTAYKNAINEQRTAYQNQAKEYLDTHSNDTATYNKFMQEINENYNDKIEAGVTYFANA